MTVIIITIIDAALQLAGRIHRGEKRRDIGDQKRCQGTSGIDATARVGATIDVVIRNGSNSVNAIIITTTITTIIPSTTNGRSGAGEELIQRRR